MRDGNRIGMAALALAAVWALALPPGRAEAGGVRIGLSSSIFREAPPSLVQVIAQPLKMLMRQQTGVSGELELAGENLLDETVVYFDSVMNFFNDASYQSFVAPPRRYSLTQRARL